MNLCINGELVAIPEAMEIAFFAKQAQDMLGFLEEEQKNYPVLALMIKSFARELLKYMEKEARKQGYGEDVALAYRPPKKGDPVKHFQLVATKLALEKSRESILELTFDASTITAFRLITRESTDRGSLDSDGNVGIGENNGIEVSGRRLHEALSTSAPLFAGQ